MSLSGWLYSTDEYVFVLKQDLMAEQDCQYLIELDGNQQPDDLFVVSQLCTNVINLH